MELATGRTDVGGSQYSGWKSTQLSSSGRLTPRLSEGGLTADRAGSHHSCAQCSGKRRVCGND